MSPIAVATEALRAAAPVRSNFVLPGASARATFLRVFNWTTIAMVFWLCLGIVATQNAPKLPVTTALPWIEETAYMVRQHLITGVLVLVAVAAAEALLPDRLGKRRQRIGTAAVILCACMLGAVLRVVVAGNRFENTREFAVWFVVTVTLWATIGVIAAGVAGAWLRDSDLRRRLLEHDTAEAALAARALEAQLAALQAQVEPHFLFNTLANVRRLYEIDGAQGRRMLGSLLDYLRAALPAMRRSEAMLADEFGLVRAYLTVLQHRMGRRLRFEVGFAPEVGGVAIPPLSVPTLVENAVRHGLAPLPEGGTVRVEASARDGGIVIAVRDDGAGFTGSSGSGVGLSNTRARLAAQFGGAAKLELRENHPRGVVAEIYLPVIPAGAA
jgi:hypothetical protein